MSRLLVAVFFALGLLLLGAGSAGAEGIPGSALKYRADLIRAARFSWGLDAPVATFAAQIHQESRWRADAESPVGARGLAQVMPSTAAWLPEIAPYLKAADAWNPGWNLRALTAYDKWLWDRVSARCGCDHMAKTLAAYNGGLGWLQKDERLAERKGMDRDAWWANVECVNAGRSPSAKKENQGYPERILHVLEPLYTASGWGRGMCHAAR